MRPTKSALVAGVAVYVGSFAFVACTGGSDSGTISSSSSGGTSSSGSSSGQGRGPGESCVLDRDGGTVTSSSSVCAVNPAHASCRMCLGLETSGLTCLYACTIGGSDCPSGQACTERPGGSSDTTGDCDGLGYCK